MDEERITSLASADATEMAFLSELMTEKFSEEVLIKWLMHPSMGPKLRSGEWFPQGVGEAAAAATSGGGLPALVREAMAEAMATGVVPGFDSAFVDSAPASRTMGDHPREEDGPKYGRGPRRAPGVPPKTSPNPGGRRFWERGSSRKPLAGQPKEDENK